MVGVRDCPFIVVNSGGKMVQLALKCSVQQKLTTVGQEKGAHHGLQWGSVDSR